MKVFSVIMAGGGGTRFWPLSRKETPKQLLNLSGKDLMINETIDRLLKVCDNKDVFVVTNTTQVAKMRVAVKGRMPLENIISEPSARNTAACIGYAAMQIMKKHGDGVMVVTPSDAYIRNSDKYASVLKEAVGVAEKTSGLVTIGITPTFPATGYGYIKYLEGEGCAKKVERFVEKPSEELAVKYLKEGGYAWNSGVFVWKVSVILEKFKEFLPDIYEKLCEIEKSIGTSKEEAQVNEIYPTIRSISIDYGVMEKASNIWVIPSEFGWSDVGSWDMMKTLHKEDENGNIKLGDTLTLDTTNSIVFSDGQLVATVGVDNLVVVATKDAILVCPKDKAQDVKKIVDKLKEEKRDNLL